MKSESGALKKKTASTSGEAGRKILDKIRRLRSELDLKQNLVQSL